VVQPGLVDPLDPGQQVEAEQPCDAEPDFGLAMRICVAGVDLYRGAVPHDALDHRGEPVDGLTVALGVDGHALALDVPAVRPG
jgi:hypothetical protein